jgi:outer membrane receptor for ferrienterochelin and colicins
VQITLPALGSANIRLQGFYGRYIQLLNDDLPFFGGQMSSIGLLQIPATVEIIKGADSPLYGGSALGGVSNFISRKPTNESEVLMSLRSRDVRSYNLSCSTIR